MYKNYANEKNQYGIYIQALRNIADRNKNKYNSYSSRRYLFGKNNVHRAL